MQDQVIAVRWSVVGLTALTWIHALLVAAWGFSAITAGFSNGILHAAPIGYEVFLVKFLSDTIGFGFPLNNLTVKHRTIVLACVLLVVAMSLNILHLVFSCIEIVECTTALCLHTYWLLFVFLFLLGFLIVIEGIVIFYLVKFDRHVKLLKKK